VSSLGVVLLSFVLGSIPTSWLFARRLGHVDLREVGSGTVSGTSLYRVTGFVPLAVAGILDIVKGAIGPLLAPTAVVAAFAGGAAVIGHNWSPFLRGAGGRGIAPAIGALLVTAWPGVILLLGSLVVGKVFRETAVGGLVGLVLLTPALALWGGATAALAGAAIALPMLVKRVLGNHPPTAPDARARGRVYAFRLVYDHDPAWPAP
jgi:glycerol-3-phosphate acyltransferase PlsY